MRRIQAEGKAILIAMLVASLISAVYYAKYQLVYSTRVIAKFIEIVFGS